MLDSVYVLCKFIDTIPAARLRLCTHKNQFDKKKQHIPREAMHRIEIKVLREEKKTSNDGRESTFDNKNIYNLTLGVVMDFRVYFGPIMLPLKVHMDPLNKCFDSTYNI